MEATLIPVAKSELDSFNVYRMIKHRRSSGKISSRGYSLPILPHSSLQVEVHTWTVTSNRPTKSKSGRIKSRRRKWSYPKLPSSPPRIPGSELDSSRDETGNLQPLLDHLHLHEPRAEQFVGPYLRRIGETRLPENSIIANPASTDAVFRANFRASIRPNWAELAVPELQFARPLRSKIS